MVEPLEETRSELTFATENIVASLHGALISDSGGHRTPGGGVSGTVGVELDEIEIQKGLLQVARGLEFLHSAKLVHGNLTSDAIMINAKVRSVKCMRQFGFLGTPYADVRGVSP